MNKYRDKNEGMVCSIDVSLAMVLSHWVWWRLRRLREARLRRQRTTPGRKIAMDSQGGGGTPPLPGFAGFRRGGSMRKSGRTGEHMPEACPYIEGTRRQ